MLALFGCSSKEYRLVFNGCENDFAGVKDHYKEGDEVEIAFPVIATDTDYSFSVDGEGFSPDYDPSRGFVLRFVMPARDVEIGVTRENTMLFVPQEDVLLLDYYDAAVATVGGDGYRELTLTRTAGGGVRLDVYEQSFGEEASHSSFDIPEEAVDACFQAVDLDALRAWASCENGVGLTGAVTVVKFREPDGSYVRASTENMPPDADRSLLYNVGSALSALIPD